MPRHRLVLILACLLGLRSPRGLAWNAGVFKSEPAHRRSAEPFQLVDQNGRSDHREGAEG
jgi:protein SCO1/2